MQPQEEPQNWQQPAQAPPAAPYQTAAPAQSDVPPSPAPVAEVVPDDGIDEPGYADDTDDSQVGTEEIAGDNDMVDEDNQAVLRWQEAEYVQYEQSHTWFIVLGVVVVVLMAVAFFLMKSITFAILIPIMAVALVVYVKRPAAIHDYTVSRKGLHVDDRLFGYDLFRAFGVLTREGRHALVLIPRKRFQLGHTIYFPESVGEPLVDMLAARLPMNDVKPDFIDSLLARLRL